MSQLRDLIENCLCPPGNGVYTVNTAKERKQALHLAIYGQTEQVDAAWRSSLAHLEDAGKVVVLGICSDSGGGILRGANWGPLYLRNAIRQHHGEVPAFDMGDVRVIPHLLHDKYINQATLDSCRKALYKDTAAPFAVSPLSITETVVAQFYKHYPAKGIFGMGGDHSVSYALVKAYLQNRKARGIRAAIIHFDAHTDLLVQRLGIDLCFGSWCAHIIADLTAPEHLIQIGIRSTGKSKQHWQDTFGVRQFWAHEVREQGAEITANTILQQLQAANIDELYVSFDIDAIDECFAAATGTPEPEGIFPDEALTILTLLSKQYKIAAADMMEIAPFTHSGSDAKAAEKTLKVGADISAFLIKAMAQ